MIELLDLSFVFHFYRFVSRIIKIIIQFLRLIFFLKTSMENGFPKKNENFKISVINENCSNKFTQFDYFT